MKSHFFRIGISNIQYGNSLLQKILKICHEKVLFLLQIMTFFEFHSDNAAFSIKMRLFNQYNKQVFETIFAKSKRHDTYSLSSFFILVPYFIHNTSFNSTLNFSFLNFFHSTIYRVRNPEIARIL